MNDAHPTRWQRRTDMAARIGYLIMLVTVVIGSILGLIAAFAGGWWSRLGNGVGGLEGGPLITLTLAMLLGLPSLVLGFAAIVRRRMRAAARMLAYFGPLVIAIGFIVIPHASDPCDLGLWGPFSKLGNTPLCERFGMEFNIHSRFHLLWHAAPTALLVAVYRLALGWWHPAWGARPDRTARRS